MGKNVIKSKGFSLAEIAVTVTLLGIVAVFAIPKILSVYEDNSKKAIFRETINMLENILTEGTTLGILGKNDNNNYFINRINSSHICSTDSKNEGCWDVEIQGNPRFEPNEPGVILPNGVRIIGLGNTNSVENGFIIDWNSTGGPNQLGQDQLWLNVCAQKNTQCNINATNQTSGTIEPITTTSPSNMTVQQRDANVALYQEIFDE